MLKHHWGINDYVDDNDDNDIEGGAPILLKVVFSNVDAQKSVPVYVTLASKSQRNPSLSLWTVFS